MVHTAESWDGEPVRADLENLRDALDASLVSWLKHLRKAAEHPDARFDHALAEVVTVTDSDGTEH